MAPIDRRRALQVTAGSLSTLLAGCFDTQSDDGDTDDGSGTDTDDSTDGGGTSSVVGVDSVQVGQGVPLADWYEDGAVGAVTLAATDERASAIVDSLDLSPGQQAPVAEFFRATDFDTSLVALVESVGPNSCYGTLETDGLAVEGGRLVGSATATASGDACAEVITSVGALVRATFDGPVPDAAAFEITNGWDETAEVTASLDDSLDDSPDAAPDPPDLPGHVRPDDDPVVRAPLTCDRSGVERHESWIDEPPWGVVTDDGGDPTVALRVDTPEAARGETVTVRLTNVSEGQQPTGNRHKHGIETLTEDGWESVWVTDSEYPLAYTDEAILHPPGEGFEWTLELTEDGLLADHTHADSLSVCPDLEPGRYRFVFWEPAVAVGFDLVE